MNLLDILQKVNGNPVALFKYDPQSNNPMRIYKGECTQFDSLGFVGDDDTIILFDASNPEIPLYYLDTTAFMWTDTRPNQITFAIGVDEFVLTFSSRRKGFAA